MKTLFVVVIVALMGEYLVEGQIQQNYEDPIYEAGQLLEKANKIYPIVIKFHELKDAALIEYHTKKIKFLIEIMDTLISTSVRESQEAFLKLEVTRLRMILDRIIQQHKIFTHPTYKPTTTTASPIPELKLKTQLLERGRELVRRTEIAITMLETNGNANKIANLKSEKAAIEQLMSQLENTNEYQDLKRVEQELTKAENLLQSELLRVNFDRRHLHTHRFGNLSP